MAPRCPKDAHHVHTDRTKTIAVLAFYLDDSGHEDNDALFVAGGAVASPEEWARFIPAWQEALRDAQVTRFHATDLRARRREFAGWKPEKARRFRRRLARIVNDHVRIGIARGVVVPDFESVPEIREFLKGERPNTRIRPIHFALRGCLEFVAQGWEGRQHEQVTVTFEKGTKKLEAALQYANWVRERADWAKGVFGAIGSDSRVNCIPLEAADFLAHSMRLRGTQVLRKPRRKWTRRDLDPELRWLAQRTRLSMRMSFKHDMEALVRDRKAGLSAPSRKRPDADYGWGWRS